MKTIKRGKVIICLAVLIMLVTSCTPIEDKILNDFNQTDHSKTSVNGPMTSMEYTSEVNRRIVPFLNEAEGYLSRQLGILNGNHPVKQELASLENSIDKTQNAIEKMDKLYPPKDYTEHKMEVITRLNEYKDALMRYKKALEEGVEKKESEKIKDAASYLNSVLASMKTAFRTY